jgi:hypothetical protein
LGSPWTNANNNDDFDTRRLAKATITLLEQSWKKEKRLERG